jgi:catechol 2,3-dioxygenase-like lactoylglutathione lyase family enzyme
MTQGPPRYHGLDHVVLCVTDAERSVDFYTRVLGMSLERIIEDFGIWQVRCGRHIIDLKQVAALAPVAERGVDHLCVLDPDGHTIELKADRAEAPLRTTGRDAAATLTRGPVAPRR